MTDGGQWLIAALLTCFALAVIAWQINEQSRFDEQCTARGGRVKVLDWGGRYRICLTPDGRFIEL